MSVGYEEELEVSGAQALVSVAAQAYDVSAVEATELR